MIPAFGVRSSVVPEFPAGPLRGQCAVPGSAGTANSVAGERDTRPRLPLAWSRVLLQLNPLPPSVTPATAFGHDQVPQVDRRVQVPVMPGPAVGAGPPGFPLQVRGSLVPQALQVLLLGNHMGARITRVWRHWPL